MEEKPSYYAIIPANVRYDKTLKDKAKLLYGEIVALSNKDGYCWATNNYFAKLYEVNKNTISRLIQDLIDKGYIEAEIKYKDDTKEIDGRYIKICTHYTHPYLQNCGYPYTQNDIYPIYQKLKDNNININNTSNNNNNNIYSFFEKTFVRTLNSIEYETMTKWLEDKTEDEIINAIKESALSNVDNIKYIQKILYGKKNKKSIPDWFNKEIPESEIEEDDDFKSFIEEFRK